MKKFIALIGESESGKSTTLNKLWQDAKGYKLYYKTKDGRAICKIDDKIVFIQTFSPQERGGIEDLKEALGYFEGIAEIFGASDFNIIMAFNSDKRKKQHNEVLDYLKSEGYTYDFIAQIMSMDILSEVKKKL